MSLSMYQASVPAFVAMLNNLDAMLEKAEIFAKERKIEESILLNWRLAPDMFAFARQIQLATDFAKGTTARLAGAEVPTYADEEASFAALRQRIAKTVSFVQSFKPADIDGSEDRDITLKLRGEEVRCKRQPYIMHFAMPNFYLHGANAYDLLRAFGLRIAMRGFIGQL